MGDTIFSRLAEIANEQRGVPTESFKLASRWREELGFDSFDLQELSLSIEEEWDISLENHGFVTVEDTVEVISAKTGNQ